MKKVLLRLYYWILYILSFAFELLNGLFTALEWLAYNIGNIVESLDDKLLKHLIQIGKKLDEKPNEADGENK